MNVFIKKQIMWVVNLWIFPLPACKGYGHFPPTPFWNSLCRPGWLPTQRLPASDSLILGLKLCTTIMHYSQRLWKFMMMRPAAVWVANYCIMNFRYDICFKYKGLIINKRRPYFIFILGSFIKKKYRWDDLTRWCTGNFLCGCLHIGTCYASKSWRTYTLLSL